MAGKGFYAGMDQSGIIMTYGVFLLVAGVWGAVTTGALHSLYGGTFFGCAVLFCAFLASFTSDNKCVAAGVHIDLAIAAVLSLVFAAQAYKSYVPSRMDRFPLFLILTLGSLSHVGAMFAKKPRRAEAKARP